MQVRCVCRNIHGQLSDAVRNFISSWLRWCEPHVGNHLVVELASAIWKSGTHHIFIDLILHFSVMQGTLGFAQSLYEKLEPVFTLGLNCLIEMGGRTGVLPPAGITLDHFTVLSILDHLAPGALELFLTYVLLASSSVYDTIYEPEPVIWVKMPWVLPM